MLAHKPIESKKQMKYELLRPLHAGPAGKYVRWRWRKPARIMPMSRVGRAVRRRMMKLMQQRGTPPFAPPFLKGASL